MSTTTATATPPTATASSPARTMASWLVRLLLLPLTLVRAVYGAVRDLVGVIQLMRRQYRLCEPQYGHDAVISHLCYNLAAKIALQLTNIAELNRGLLGWVDSGMRWHRGARQRRAGCTRQAEGTRQVEPEAKDASSSVDCDFSSLTPQLRVPFFTPSLSS